MNETSESTTFGQYHLLHKLGEGGMGFVHVGEIVGEAGFRKRVAIKRMHRHFQNDQRLLEFFATEARTNARIDHPNVVHVLEFGLEPEPYIVMEYIDGVSLRALLWRFHERRWAMDLRAATLICAEAALGLDSAHRLTDASGIPLGIVHRDISPSNIMISSEGVVKVSDFGLVMVADNPFTANNDIPVGKPNYMSPEQAECRPLDARADVFALGLVLWESLTQRQLLPANDLQGIRNYLATCNFYPPSRFNPHVPPELDWITSGCLQKSPQSRWASADALSLSLRQLLHTRGRGFDRVHLANIVRSAFPERGWGPRQPAQPPLQPTKSQIAQLPQALRGQETSADPPMPQFEQTTPGHPQIFPPGAVDDRDVEEAKAEAPHIFGLTSAPKKATPATEQFVVAQLERSMWMLQTSRPLENGVRLRGPSQGQLMIVVDGGAGRSVGGFGGVIVLDALSHYVFSTMPWAVPRSDEEARELGKGLVSAVRSCAKHLGAVASAGGLESDGDVSVTAAYLLWPDLFVVHTGAGRCSLLRGGKLSHITRVARPKGEEGQSEDTSVARVLVAPEKISGDGLELELLHLELDEGDGLLLESDGLSASLERAEVEKVLRGLGAGERVEDCARTLVNMATQKHAEEVTVIVARY